MDQGEAGERRPDAVGEPAPGEYPGEHPGDDRDTGEFPLVPAPRMANGWPVAIGSVSVPDALQRVAADLRSQATDEPEPAPEPEYAPPKSLSIALVSASGLLLAGACVFAALQGGNPDLPAGRAGTGRPEGVVALPLPVALTSATALATPSVGGSRTAPPPPGAPAARGGAVPGGDQGAGQPGGSSQGKGGASGGGKAGGATPGGGATGSRGGTTTGPVSGGTPTSAETGAGPNVPAPEPQPTEGGTANPPITETPAG